MLLSISIKTYGDDAILQLPTEFLLGFCLVGPTSPIGLNLRKIQMKLKFGGFARAMNAPYLERQSAYCIE